MKAAGRRVTRRRAGAGRPGRRGRGLALGLLAAASVATAMPVAEGEGEGGPEAPWPSVRILGGAVEPGEKARQELVVSESLAGAEVPTPVFVHHGVAAGPTLCLTAGIHGDEINGVEIVRRVVGEVDAARLSGTLISMPIVNLSAVRRASRYLPDRRDLNRYFPGRAYGSSASRIAHRIFEEVIRRCDALVDLHTGSFHRSNVHQLRADLRDPDVVDLARGLGSPIVVHKEGREGTLRGAAVAAGIPAVTIEGGEPLRLSLSEVDAGVETIFRLMAHLGMTEDGAAGEGGSAGSPGQEFYYRSHWVRAPTGGILVTDAQLGQRIAAGEVLGTVTDPLSSRSSTLESLYSGRVIGIAFDQLVMPGFATIHIGVENAASRDIFVPQIDDDEARTDGAADEVELEERPE